MDQVSEGNRTFHMGNYLEKHQTIDSWTVKEYIHADGVRIALRINESDTFWFHDDHLGGTNKVTRENGNVSTTVLYTPWGEVRYEQGEPVTDRLYTDQPRIDDDHNLYYYGARWYDPSLGRFLQADSIVPSHQGTQGWDKYAYVNNNPTGLVDEDGDFAWLPVIALAGGIVGAAVNYIGQVKDNYENNGGDLVSAMSDDIDVGSVLSSAAAGATFVFTAAVAAPVAISVAGSALMGVGMITGSTTLFAAGMTTTAVAGTVAAVLYGLDIAGPQLPQQTKDAPVKNPLENVQYSDRVLDKMNTFDDYHSFPLVVDNYSGYGSVTQTLGNNGAMYTHVNIPGGYKGSEGVFHYIIDSENILQHRLFEPFGWGSNVD